MNKLIILTTSIIRGDFHKKSIGKFYEYFYEYLKEYEVYHIINIDEPEKLKEFFNKNETIEIYNSIIPENINKIFITEENPGFLQAWKKIVSKIEEMQLIDDNYLYYWLEDDWEPRNKYDIIKLLKCLNFKNSAYSITDNSPLGSFRGGPFMSGSYFNNIFNIKKYMNNTCDPEKQMQRWLRGNYQKNGNETLHRLSIKNDNIENKKINIIIVCKNENINLNDLNKHHYKKGFDKSIKFYYHLIVYNDNYEIKYSSINEDNNYNLQNIDSIELKKIFEDNSIKYFVIKPSIQFDIGRFFNKEYNLNKWSRIEHNTCYS
jgi:hypothetical protein